MTNKAGACSPCFAAGTVQRAGNEGPVELTFARDAIDLSRLWVGQSLWKTDEPALTARLQKTFRNPEAKNASLRWICSCRRRLDNPWWSSVMPKRRGLPCPVGSLLAPASQHPLTEKLLRTQLGRLGRSAYQLRELEVRLDGQPMVPLSVLGRCGGER